MGNGSTDETLAAPESGDGPSGSDAPLTRGDGVGRYVVLSKIGQGGMGVVFAAYDPELDRKVALKLLHATSASHTRGSEGHQRLLREAQAMAQLQHPNTVAVHDVGAHAGRVWLAMEFIEGQTLSHWLEQPRRWTEVLEVFDHAAAGLSAAHEKGLIHRDFKPDNVMIGDDGRVRVMDFGLARAEVRPAEDRLPVEAPFDSVSKSDRAALSSQLTQAGALLGTPAYMAPEQWAGEVVDARSDQFSFCVALWEALWGSRPFAAASLAALSVEVLEGRIRAPDRKRGVPRWLERVVRQGLSTRKEDRFASMEALLEAFARGRRRARRGAAALALAAVAGVAGGSAGYVHWQEARQLATCEATGASIFASWNDDARARVVEAFVDTKTSFAETTAAKVIPRLDDYAEQWARDRSGACLDFARGNMDERTVDRARWCLDERRSQFDTLVDQFQVADATGVRLAVGASSSLPLTAQCRDPAALSTMPPPPQPDRRATIDQVRRALAKARSLEMAGKYEEALAEVEVVLEEARAADWPPIAAKTDLSHGMHLISLGRLAGVESILTSAYTVAASFGDWESAARAANQLSYLVGYRLDRPTEGILWAEHAAVALAHAADPSGLLEADRLNNLGIIYLTAGDYGQAEDSFSRSLAIRERELGVGHPSVGRALSNLAFVSKERGEHRLARERFERALEVVRGALGPEHPDVATAVSNVGQALEDEGAFAEAEEKHQTALRILESALGPQHVDIAEGLLNLVRVYRHTEEHEKALPLVERALAILEAQTEPEAKRVNQALLQLGWIQQQRGDYPASEAAYRRVLVFRERTVGMDHPLVANTLLQLARVVREQSRLEDAIDVYERAIAIRESKLGSGHPDTEAAREQLTQTLRELGPRGR